MTDRRRDLLASLVVLTAVFSVLLLALVYLGSAWVRAGGLTGALMGIVLSGRRDPPPYGRLLHAGPAQPLTSEEDRILVAGLRRQRRMLPLIGALLALVVLLAAVAGSLSGHPRYAPFIGGRPSSGSPSGETSGSPGLPDPSAEGAEAADLGGNDAVDAGERGRFGLAVLYQAAVALLAAWLGVLSGVTSGWLGLAMAERAESSDSVPGL